MADVIINLVVPSEKVAKALEGFLKIYPNSEMTEEETPKNKYTDKEWVTERIKRLVIRDVRRGLQMTANETTNIAEEEWVTL